MNHVRVHVRFQMVQGQHPVRVHIRIHVMAIIPVRVVHRRARRVRDVRRGGVRPLVHVLGGHAMWRRVIQTTMHHQQPHVHMLVPDIIPQMVQQVAVHVPINHQTLIIPVPVVVRIAAHGRVMQITINLVHHVRRVRVCLIQTVVRTPKQ